MKKQPKSVKRQNIIKNMNGISISANGEAGGKSADGKAGNGKYQYLSVEIKGGSVSGVSLAR